MIPQSQRIPHKRKTVIATDQARKRIFCKVRDLGLDDEARRLIASQCRKDSKETMRGMNAVELARMEFVLDNQIRQRRTNEAMKADLHRRKRLQQKKRVDEDGSEFASERARHWLRQQAEIYWGEQWPQRLAGLFAKMIRDTGIVPENALTATIKGETITTINWNDGRIPKRLHWDVCRAMTAMMGRESKAERLKR
ncbi:MAG: hypothetical protein PHI18_00235 [bacterium]|nr:hypothetical protein [bacterium]